MTFKFLPNNGHLTSLKGARKHPNHGRVVQHWGVDFSGISGNDNIIAIGNGVCRLSEYQDGYGNVIIITHPASKSTNNIQFESLYAHLASRDVRVGDKVSAGQIIGQQGNTGKYGNSKHLHFELFSPKFSSNYSTALDPLLYIKGDEFTNIQVKLKRAGDDSVEIDGYFGKDTMNAIKRFQKKHNLEIDGFAGLSTMRLLDIASTAIIPPVPNPTSTPQPDQVASTHSVPKPTSDKLTLSSPSLKAEIDNILASKANITKIIETAIKGGANEKVWMDKLEKREYTDFDVLALATKYIIDTNK